MFTLKYYQNNLQQFPTAEHAVLYAAEVEQHRQQQLRGWPVHLAWLARHRAQVVPLLTDAWLKEPLSHEAAGLALLRHDLIDLPNATTATAYYVVRQRWQAALWLLWTSRQLDGGKADLPLFDQTALRQTLQKLADLDWPVLAVPYAVTALRRVALPDRPADYLTQTDAWWFMPGRRLGTTCWLTEGQQRELVASLAANAGVALFDKVAHQRQCPSCQALVAAAREQAFQERPLAAI